MASQVSEDMVESTPVRDELPGLGEEIPIEIEVPRLSFVKRGPDGAVRFVSPLPTLFNYGSVPGTRAADGDPFDVVLLGPRRPRGAHLRARILGAIDFVDDGRPDPKLIAGTSPLRPWQRAQVSTFFRIYARAKRSLDPQSAGAQYRGWLF